MPRVGRHPLKEKLIKENQVMPQNVTMTTIVYIPTLDGYWKESFDVLKLFFRSLQENTNEPYDLMVFDNGSCSEIRDYMINLRDQGIIQYLILSEKNLRKLGALNYLLQSAPGEFISYADSDVYFLPGWLDESLKVLNTFPEAAKLTALPIVGGDTTQISESSYKSALKDSSITVETGKLVSNEFVEAHNISIGKSLKKFEETNPNRKDTKLTRNGISAFLSGADFQFTIKKDALKEVLPLLIENEEDYYDPIYSPILEKKLYNHNWWQLSTSDYFIHHLGNKKPNLGLELPWREINDSSLEIEDIPFRNRRYILNKYIRKILKIINLWSYKKLYGK
ncbi:MAG: glycosyltransferase [Candidatus Marinimicrobia bacterium]|jgi:glycosyltransferase involved in cell wall biosynthesis|nr:glycosyltransferase [Candidatus Neomarinimicrobiota bacterium]